MPKIRQYGRRMLEAAPRWMKYGFGRKLIVGFSSHLDRLVDGMTYSQLAQHPSELGPLDLIGDERGIAKGFGESNESYALRLRSWRKEHSRRGTGFALMNQLKLAMGTSIHRSVLVYRNGVTWTLAADGSITRGTSTERDADGDPGMWARWWLRVEDGELDPGVVQTIQTITREWNASHCFGYATILNGDKLWNNPGFWNSTDPWNSNGLSVSWTVEG